MDDPTLLKTNANSTVKEYSEEDLIRHLREGHEQAFKVIFDTYYRPLTLFAMKYTGGDVEEAKEIVQEFFVRFWSKRHDVTIRFSLKTYLYAGVRNACLNVLASSKVAQRKLRDYTVSEVSNDNALELMLVAEQEHLLMQAIDRLPDKCRQIFYFSRMEKLSNQAIADRLQLSVKTVEAQISIALKRLREILISLFLMLVSWG
nr:RNA polymerase sigma-70 factor [Dawidia cretensis]